MKTKNLLNCFIAVALICIIFAACKKKEDAPAPVVPPAAQNADAKDASDNALAETTFNDASNIADQGAEGSLSSFLATNSSSQEKGILSSCASITIDTLSGPNHTITINFGSTPCLCGDLRYRSGIITVHFQGHYNAIGSTLSITYTSYTVNGNLVNGTHTITRDANVGLHPHHTIDVNGTIVKASGAGTITWISHRTREWTDGYTTTTGVGHRMDDVFSISGYTNGVYSSANTRTFRDTLVALKIHLNCGFIESGHLNISPTINGTVVPTRYIDFGTDGSCDNQATVVVSGTTYNITLQ